MTKKEEWNLRYNTAEFIYGLDPNTFFKEEIKKLSPGNLLLPGDGEGRNSLWAASQGWSVTAFDFSEIAVDKANKLLKKHNINKVSILNCDIESFESNETYDVVALIYLHLPSSIREDAYKKMIRFLKPNGTIILECYHPDQLGRFSGGPKNPDLFASIDEIRSIFSSLTLLSLGREEIELNEGKLHQGEAVVIRMVGKNSEEWQK